MATSYGEHLLNEILPPEHRGKGPLTKSKLTDILVSIAKDSPETYPATVVALKRLGDETATSCGLSVGLDDIDPGVKARDVALNPHFEEFRKATTYAAKEKALLGGQSAMLAYTKQHTGSMGELAASGSRGNYNQLSKIIASPVVTRDDADRVVPWFLRKSYAEGISSADAWVAGNEARLNAIKSNISVVEPGDLAKILVNNLGNTLITVPDCETKNGIVMKSSDPHIADRYLAHPAAGLTAGTLITPQSLSVLRKGAETVVVRSPMTCEAPHGLCQKCRGLSPAGHLYGIGTNVGVMSSQAVASPLTQIALGAKHGGNLARGQNEPKLEGIKGVRQLLEIPESFLHKATLAEHDGKVSKVEDAPQGGRYVWVNDTRHYLGPDLKLKTPVGTVVEAGDMLSNGVPKPDEVVHHKGLGEGRRYLVEALHGVYHDSGVELDKRHFETIAKSLLNHVYVTDPGEEHDHGLLKGDVIDYNRFKASIGSSFKAVPTTDAVGETLASDFLHYTAGTRVTPTVRDALKKQGITDVSIGVTAPQVDPVMRTASRSPLMNPDFMQRLAHRYLKESLMAGAHRGDVSELHGYNPAPGYAAGTIGFGPEGRY